MLFSAIHFIVSLWKSNDFSRQWARLSVLTNCGTYSNAGGEFQISLKGENWTAKRQCQRILTVNCKMQWTLFDTGLKRTSGKATTDLSNDTNVKRWQWQWQWQWFRIRRIRNGNSIKSQISIAKLKKGNVLGHFWPWSQNFKFEPCSYITCRAIK